MSRTLLILAIAALALTGCGDNDSDQTTTQTAVPLPKAFPRIPTYDTVYVTTDSLPCGFEINANALVSIRRPDTAPEGTVWADISYPAYNSTLRITFTPVTASTRHDVIANRRERMMLNFADNPVQIKELQSTGTGYTTTILTAPTARVTPVQFVGFNDRWVISGALQMHRLSNSDPDSIMPMLRAVERDICHSATHLR